NFTDVSVFSTETFVQFFEDSDGYRIILNTMNSLLTITILVSIIAISYFSFVTISERKREIGVLRSIGMIRRQIFLLLLFEGLLLLLTSLVMGGIAGVFISLNFFYLLTGGSDTEIVPPLHIAFPIDVMVLFGCLLLVFTIIACAYPAYRMSSRSTGSILRAE
ncbi:MAG: FtsX-like permease family protein, partial [Candidatus Heimdallarchaeota archaeon]|nr:FtsX-like permease family protein [Candidatus Heimdallarchaeota archaeon]